MNYLVVFFALAAPFLLLAQEADTVLLEEVVIDGAEFQRFSNGSSHQKISINPQSSTLEQALLGEVSVHFRSYGNQQLSSITFRGSSASQTNVLWHGVPANFATLGQMDFSQWPTWFIESLFLEAGSSGALYGSGSIGGTVLLDAEVPTVQPSLTLKTSLGNFGGEFYGVKGAYEFGKWSGQTKAFYSHLDNDFPFALNGERVRQPNASVANWGAQQQISYRNRNHSWSLDVQLSENDREIQPSKLSMQSTDELLTRNARFGLTHQVEQPRASLTTTVALLKNTQLYNRFDRTAYNQVSLVSSYLRELSNQVAFRVGGNVNRFTAQSDYYPTNFIDHQAALFGSLEFTPALGWKSTLNLRQSFYKQNAPFTPSLGQTIALLKSAKHQVILRGTGSFGFRFPTLNDLHWRPGGNPDLLPEESFSLEGGADWIAGSKRSSSVSFTVFQTWSENWITWLPMEGGFSAPQNFRSVKLSGFETRWKWAGETSYFLPTLQAFYSFNQAHTRLDETDRQMPYTPYHLAGLSAKATSSFLEAAISANYTSRRYVTLDNVLSQSVDGFLIVDACVNGRFTTGKLGCIPAFQVNNLFDIDYENLLNRAMPGRHYQISLTLKLE